MTLRTYLKRPEWLYGSGAMADPIKRFSFHPSSPSNDELLCERLIAAHRLACAQGSVALSGIWRGNISKYYSRLEGALVTGNAGDLSRLLARMFQDDFLSGITSCSHGIRAGTFTRMKLTEELVSLAESVGVVRTEVPEQGMLGQAIEDGLDGMVERIENVLKASLAFPRVGGAYGLEVKGRLITPETPEHMYVATRIRDAIELRYGARFQPRIVEIGAGFGGTAYRLLQLLRVEHYAVVDLPLMNVCQGYFFAKVFGGSAVQLYGEPNGSAKIQVLPSTAKADASSFDVLINENSMPEIPESAVRDYLHWARMKGATLFYSYNQEALSRGCDGVVQTLVPEVAATVGDYTRLTRNNSWIRRGYVEEVYEVGPKRALSLRDLANQANCPLGQVHTHSASWADVRQEQGLGGSVQDSPQGLARELVGQA